jgi:serine/threonine protein kinase/formylglycine-generating enzyme required for sulfatase activity
MDVTDLFAGFLGDEPDDHAAAIERLCAQHPEQAARLRAMYREWLIVRRVAATIRIDDAGHSADGWRRYVEGLGERGPSWDRYLDVKELGRGGHGAVIDATDPDLGRSIAKKVLLAKPGDAHHEDLQRRFLHEAKITAKLEHPGIVPIHEIGVDADNLPYFTMKLVKGRTFRGVIEAIHLREEGWTLERGLRIFERVCEALAYAHSRGIIHRDLKPVNIMVGDFGETYVMDWGLAKDLNDPMDGLDDPAAQSSIATASPLPPNLAGLGLDATLPGVVMGTIRYMSPEQARAEPARNDVRSDVYAMGVILYELLCGDAPFHDRDDIKSVNDLVAAVGHERPTSTKQLAPNQPDELHSICAKAMAPKQRDRYPSIAAFATSLRQHLEKRVVDVHESGAFAELRKWVQRSPYTAGALGLLFVSITVGFFIQRSLRAVADELVGDVFQLRHNEDLDNLMNEADALWPADSAHVAPLTDWLRRANLLRPTLDQYRAKLASLRARQDLDENEQWWSGMLVEAVGTFESFFGDDPATAIYANVSRRLERAEALRGRTIDAHTDAWRRAQDALATDPRFAGVDIPPQEGLVPLGPDPKSGLQEFSYLPSGDIPTRGADGTLQLTDDSALVLVLVPGGEFVMGATNSAEPGDNLSLFAKANEAPGPNPVRLDPFFIGKHELLRAQYLRLVDLPVEIDPNAPLDPLTAINRYDTEKFLDHHGLVLPTEAQWEYAVRAGTRTIWWCGNVAEDLARCGNLKDLAFLAELPPGKAKPAVEPWNDGYAAFPAEINAFEPNPWGLYGTIGNVWEWVADFAETYETPATNGDGFRGDRVATRAIIRGAGFQSTGREATSTYRFFWAADQRADDTGVRVAKKIAR